MKSIQEITDILTNSRKYNIWNNPNRPNNFDTNCCEYCGKKAGKNPLQVHVTYTGTCLPTDITEEEVNQVEESQGCFTIGSECAKKLFGKEIKNYTI